MMRAARFFLAGSAITFFFLLSPHPRRLELKSAQSRRWFLATSFAFDLFRSASRQIHVLVRLIAAPFLTMA